VTLPLTGRKNAAGRLDLRPQALEITAQEMLTKDRIALRVTLTALRRIADPERAVAPVTDIDAWLYRLVQFAIREAVAARTLDEVLSAKAVLDAELRNYVRERVAMTGVEVMELGVKDVSSRARSAISSTRWWRRSGPRRRT
jgi:regulator of protease activity HflC (stomatin/prohibitin superfamily)